MRETPLQTTINGHMGLIFRHLDILEWAVKDILGDEAIAKQFVPRSTGRGQATRDGSQTEVIGEPWEADWWITMQATYPDDVTPLVFVLYADATKVVERGQLSFHPIFLSVLNLPTAVRHTERAKRMVGLLPRIPAHFATQAERNRPEWRYDYYRMIHECLQILLKPLERTEPVVVLDAAGRYHKLVPRLGYLVADYMEHVLFMLTFGANGQCACLHCLCRKAEMHSTTSPLIMRTEAVERALIDRAKTAGLDEAGVGAGAQILKQHSIRHIDNAFWNRSDNAYMLAAPDVMHMLDEGIFKRTCSLIFEWLSANEESLVNMRLMQMSMKTHPALKTLPHNFTSLTDLEAAQLVTAMQLLPLAIADFDTDVVSLMAAWPYLYERGLALTFTEEELVALQTDIELWANSWTEQFGEATFPKFHIWVRHFVQFIRRYGTAMGFHAGTWEHHHAVEVKRPYRISNKKNVEQSLMKKSMQRHMHRLIGKAQARRALVADSAKSTHKPREKHELVGRAASETTVEGLSDIYKTALRQFDAMFGASGNTLQAYSSCTNFPRSKHPVHASPSFHGRQRKDDVVVDGGDDDDGNESVWYASVLQFALYDHQKIAFVQWYEFIPTKQKDVLWHGYQRLQSSQKIDVIPVDSIIRRAHLVVDPASTSKEKPTYLVNNFLFDKYL